MTENSDNSTSPPCIAAFENISCDIFLFLKSELYCSKIKLFIA